MLAKRKIGMALEAYKKPFSLELEEIYKKQTKLYYICSVLRISSYDENGIVFLSEGQKIGLKNIKG